MNVTAFVSLYKHHPAFLTTSNKSLMEEGNSTTGAGALIKWLDTPAGTLVQIEVLVITGVLLLAFLTIFGSYRRRSRNSFLKFALWTAYTLSDVMVSYTLGLMLSASFLNELFVIWALFLLIIFGSPDFILAYSLDDNYQWKRQRALLFVKIYFLGLFFNKYFDNSRFKYVLILLLFVAGFKLAMRCKASELACQTPREAVETKLVSDFMQYEYGFTSNEGIGGCNYLIFGFYKADIEVNPPEYRLRLKKPSNAVTIGDIWNCNGPLLRSSSTQGQSKQLTDLCLSFALFRLLRRRFAGYQWAEARHPKAWDFVVEKLLGGLDSLDFERALRVIEVELTFLYDFFYTKYALKFLSAKTAVIAMVFSSIAIFTNCWLALLLTNYKSPEGERHLVFGKQGRDMDAIISTVMAFAIAGLEVWEVVAFVFSNWAKVLLLCKYVQNSSWQGNVHVEKVLAFICRPRVTKYWENVLGQYSLLKSYSYEPLNLLYKSVSFIIPNPFFLDETKMGQKASPSIQLPNEVKKAVIESLVRIKNRGLTNGLSSLARNEANEMLSWACQLETNTHTILVWHLATTLCEMNPSNKSESELSEEHRFNKVVAKSISGYCAYLVVFIPELLPDHSHDVAFIFDEVVFEANKFLQDCRTMGERYSKMVENSFDANGTIVKKGAKLGKQLIVEMEVEERRWKLLAEFWAEMMLYLAPSDNVKAHAEHLADGGEFITHLWALLAHAGILERPSAPVFA